MSGASGVSEAPEQAAQVHARPVRRFFVFVLAVLLVSQLAVSLFAWSLAEQQFVPELERKAQTVGASLANKLTRALGYGIPMDKLVGAEAFFAEVLHENADLAFLSLSDDRGQVLFRSSKALPAGPGGDASASAAPEVAVDVTFEGRRVGQLHVGVDQQYVASRIAGLRYDIAIVLVTSLLIAFEVLWLVVTLNLSAPTRQVVELMTRMANGDFREDVPASQDRPLATALNRLLSGINQAYAELVRLATEPARRAAASPLIEGLRQRYQFAEHGLSRPVDEHRLVVVRILTLLFMSAEMLSRSFLPLYAGSLSDHGLGLPDGLRASVPITAFLLGVALSMPFAGRWSDQIGRRRSYIAGALFVATGLASVGLIPDYLVLVIGRTITGVGYALMYMACQGFVIDRTNLRDPGKGFAMFIGAISIAEICAPAIGGVLADRIGYRLVFIAGAAVALIAAALATRLLDQSPGGRVGKPLQRLRLSALAGNYRFWTLAMLSGVPAKLLYTGFLMFLVPVLLSGLGSSQSEIGRYTMIYGLMAVALAPMFARLADRYDAHAQLVGLGGLLSGLGLLPVLGAPSTHAVLLGIAAIGLGQSMSISAQMVLLTRATRALAQQTSPGQVVGVFRLLERSGAAAGPVVVGALVSALGAPKTMTLLGGLALLSSLLFAGGFLLTRKNAAREELQ